MASLFDARCLGCGYEQQVIRRTDYAYRLTEAPNVFLWAQFAWCGHCEEVVLAEKLLTAAEMDEWIADITNKRIRRDTERYREMLAFRCSPARCLRCGSVDIHAASGGREERHILHPDCGSDIVLHHAGFARLGHTDVYSPEGKHLETVNGILVPGRGYCDLAKFKEQPA